MNILDLPTEVMEGHILPFLGWNERLRFRLVCTTTKKITNHYLNIHPHLVPELEINMGEKSFRAFLKMGIPAASIFLNNATTGSFIYVNNTMGDLSKFLEQYGGVVKHLRVQQVSFHCKLESKFLNSLANLESFEAGYVEAADLQLPSHQKRCPCLRMSIGSGAVALRNGIGFDISSSSLPFPDAFTRLKVLKIGQRSQDQIVNIFSSTSPVFSICTKLEHVSLPFNNNFKFAGTSQLDVFRSPKYSQLHAFSVLSKAIRERYARSCSSKTAALKVVDFEWYHDVVAADTTQGTRIESIELYGSQVFLALCDLCLKNDVKLKNVGALWFGLRVRTPELTYPELGKPVISLVNLHPCVLPLQMPNLERIEIRKTSKSCVGPDWEFENRPDWPNLKSLDITVDSISANHLQVFPVGNSRVFSEETNCLFRFLFQRVRRPALTELRINFKVAGTPQCYANTDAIRLSCPNLKKLTLINWRESLEWPRMSLTRLWDGCLALEEISLEKCSDVSDLTFLGADISRPVFLKLSKLKKLTLKDLDKTPKLTDATFINVFAHLNLTHFTLTSKTPVKSVTRAGILSLLNGSFAESIEKFPFRDWSLVNVTPREFKKLEMKFKCVI